MIILIAIFYFQCQIINKEEEKIMENTQLYSGKFHIYSLLLTEYAFEKKNDNISKNIRLNNEHFFSPRNSGIAIYFNNNQNNSNNDDDLGFE